MVIRTVSSHYSAFTYSIYNLVNFGIDNSDRINQITVFIKL